MAKSGNALSENELNLASGGKIVVDSNDGKAVLGYHLYGDVNGEDQGYFKKGEEEQLKAVAKAWGTSLEFVKNRPGNHGEKTTSDSLADLAAKSLSSK